MTSNYEFFDLMFVLSNEERVGIMQDLAQKKTRFSELAEPEGSSLKKKPLL